MFVRGGILLELDSTGAFVSGPLPTGELSLSLKGPEVMLPSGFNSSSGVEVPTLEFARLELKAGEALEREFDLRESWPGAIQALVRRAGQPAVGVVVEVAEAGEERGGRSGAITGSDGTATIECLFPGDYTVLARSVEGQWRRPLWGTVHVAPGETTTCSIEFVLASGVLLVRDEESGAPLANEDVWLAPTADSGRAMLATTDAEGRLELEFAVGSYELARYPLGFWPGRERVTVEWTATGPVPAEVRLSALRR